jgi:cell division transport system permease protein
MNTIKYYIRDSKEGIRRNLGASIATVLLIFISLSVTASLFLAKTTLDDVIHYLDFQIKIKVFVDPAYKTNEVADLLQKNPLIKSVQIETKQETLDRLKQFFAGREYLLLAFQDSKLPDAITLELKDKKDTARFAAELKTTKGIDDIIYAQKYTELINRWSDKMTRYGILILSIFILSSFLTMSVAINLSLYQRQKEIRVKLLLGAKESHVRGQFLFEGLLLGLFGSLLASFATFIIYQYFLIKLSLSFSDVFRFNNHFINICIVLLIVVGSIVGLLSSYISTRKLIKNA